MGNGSLKERDIEDVLKTAGTHLSAVGETRGIMEVFVKCTIDLGRKLEETATEIKKFNNSTTKLTRVMIALTIILAIATSISAYVTYKTHSKDVIKEDSTVEKVIIDTKKSPK